MIGGGLRTNILLWGFWTSVHRIWSQKAQSIELYHTDYRPNKLLSLIALLLGTNYWWYLFVIPLFEFQLLQGTAVHHVLLLTSNVTKDINSFKNTYVQEGNGMHRSMLFILLFSFHFKTLTKDSRRGCRF